MDLPLIRRYPGTTSLPRIELGDLPTPVEVLDLGLDLTGLLVKRDDLTSSLYGGNKVRKLEWLFGQARVQGAKAVLTFGAYGSNHALATAVHAKALGLEPHVVLSPQEPGPFAARTLRAHAGLGTVIHLADGWDGRREAVKARAHLIERDGVEPYVIPMGGTDRHGTIGYVNAALELTEQIEADVVYVPGGTLGTAVGLALGFAAAEKDTRVVAVRVTPAEVANADFATDLALQTSWLLSLADPDFPQIPLRECAFELRDDWFEPGYGIVTPETREAVDLAASADLGLETTYTGKAFAALLADADAGDLVGERVVFWDTYNSAPMPAAGADELLPPLLQSYVAECDRLFAGDPEAALS